MKGEMVIYIAHYNEKNPKNPHYLHEHVNGMLKLLSRFDTSFDYYGLTKSSIILHDVGKKSKRFQSYIVNPKDRRGTIQHAIGGSFALYHQTIKKLDKNIYL